MTILEAYMHIHVKDEVSMTTYMDSIAYERKVQNGCHLKSTSKID